MPGHVVGIVDVRKQTHEPIHLGTRFQQFDSAQLGLPELPSATGLHERPVEGEFVSAGEQSRPFLYSGLADVRIDWCSTHRKRVHLVGVQAGVDHREPAALAVPDEIDPAAELLHGLRHAMLFRGGYRRTPAFLRLLRGFASRTAGDAGARVPAMPLLQQVASGLGVGVRELADDRRLRLRQCRNPIHVGGVGRPSG